MLIYNICPFAYYRYKQTHNLTHFTHYLFPLSKEENEMAQPMKFQLLINRINIIIHLVKCNCKYILLWKNLQLRCQKEVNVETG